jgi:phage-related protein
MMGFMITAHGGEGIASLLFWLASYIWTRILEVMQMILKALAHGFAAMLKVPMWVWILVGVGMLTALLFEESREVIASVVSKITARLKAIYHFFRDFIKLIWEAIKEVWDVTKPIFKAAGEFFLYQLQQAALMMEQLDELEAEKMGTQMD